MSDFHENGVPKSFVAVCQKALGVLHAWAQLDLMDSGQTPSFFTVATLMADGTLFMDCGAVTPAMLGWPGAAALACQPLLPEKLGDDESNQVMIDLACMMLPQDPSFVIRVTNDVWMPADGLTPYGVEFLKRLPPSQQVQLSGAVPLWVAEFLSPGNQWYGRSRHTIYAGQIASADFLTAAVGRVIPVGSDVK